MNNNEMLKIILEITDQAQASNSLLINFNGESSYTDFLFICDGSSRVHTRSICERIEIEMKTRKILPLGIDGKEEGNWISIDYNTIVIHVFIEEFRGYYDLDSLFVKYKVPLVLDEKG